MALTLTSHDLLRISHAARVLSSPLDHATADHWRSAASEALRELLEADTCGFHLPLPGHVDFHSDHYSETEVAGRDYVAPPPLPDGTCIVQRSVDLGVCTLEGAYGDASDVLLRSDYYNEYARPLRKAQTLFGACAWGRPSEDTVACIQFYRDHATRRRFGERELVILGLLYPAFRSGVDVCVLLDRHRADLLTVLDGIDCAALVWDAHRRAGFRTAALERLLDAEPERGAVEASLAASAARFAAGHAGASVAGPIVPDARGEIRTSSARYRVSHTTSSGGEVGGGTVVASLQRLTPVEPTADELRARFGTTAAEARVAALLARGESNAAIARALTISEHTARRHTEAVFRKLGVSARAEVGARLRT
jgi:DNA-binding CsgD family transcriptional regulator